MAAPHRMTLQFFLPKSHTGFMNIRVTTTIIAAVLVPLLSAAPTGSSARKQGLQMALGANAKQVAQYQWKQRITVVRKGHRLEPTVQEVRFDASGQPVRTVLVKPAEKHYGPLKARKVAEVKDDIQETLQLAFRYANPRELAGAIERGEIWEGPAALRVHARSILLPVDEADIVVEPSTFLITRVDIKTLHDGHPVKVAIVYEQLPTGPSVMRRMTVQMPEEDIVVNVESFDFVRLAGLTIH